MSEEEKKLIEKEEVMIETDNKGDRAVPTVAADFSEGGILLKLLNVIKSAAKALANGGFYIALGAAEVINTVFTGRRAAVITKEIETASSADIKVGRRKMREENINEVIGHLAKQGKSEKEIREYLRQNLKVGKISIGRYNSFIINECVKNKMEKVGQAQANKVKSKDVEVGVQKNIGNETFCYSNHQKLFEEFIREKYNKSFKEFMSVHERTTIDEEYKIFCFENKLMSYQEYVSNDLYEFLQKEVRREGTDIGVVISAMQNRSLSHFDVDVALDIANGMYVQGIMEWLSDKIEEVCVHAKVNNEMIELENGSCISFYTEGKGDCLVKLFNERDSEEHVIDLDNETDVLFLCEVLRTSGIELNDYAAELAIERALYEHDKGIDTIPLRDGSEIIVYSNELEKEGLPIIDKKIFYAEAGDKSAVEITIDEAKEIYKEIQFEKTQDIGAGRETILEFVKENGLEKPLENVEKEEALSQDEELYPEENLYPQETTDEAEEHGYGSVLEESENTLSIEQNDFALSDNELNELINKMSAGYEEDTKIDSNINFENSMMAFDEYYDQYYER